MGKHRTEEERRAEVYAWRTSGLSASEYCEAHGVTKGSLARWVVETDTVKAPMSFVRLEVAPPASPAASTLTVEVGGARVVVSTGFDPDLLLEVVVALSPERS